MSYATHSTHGLGGPKGSVGTADPSARAWCRDDIDPVRDGIFYDIGPDLHRQIRSARDNTAANGLTLETVEQEDFRLPAFARDVAGLRDRLDHGRGFVILRGIDDGTLTESQAEIVAWALCNYLGQPIRQGIDHDRRLFTVADKGAANTDPTRIGASPRRSPKHSDNGSLEPRPPCYLGLYCFRSASAGGESTLITARTIHDVIAAERPDLLPIYFDTYHFRAPQAHVWRTRGPTIRKPILEWHKGELRIHYARVMIEPGMEMAGTPLTDRQREALDYLDEVLERPELNFRHLLREGEMLVINNLVMLHGREAFAPGTQGGRTLKRLWMWRRHIGPGTDPAALDMEELT